MSRKSYSLTHRCFINSPGSSGTHLLLKICGLLGMSRANPDRYSAASLSRFSGQSVLSAPHDSFIVGAETLQTLPVENARQRQKAYEIGNYGWDHLPYSPGFSALLVENDIRQIVIIRDPRGMAVSAARHRLWHWENNSYPLLGGGSPTFKLLLHDCIHGREDISFIPLDRRIEGFALWSGQPNSLLVKFEDLIGHRGGGSQERSEHCLRAILSHIGTPPPPSLIDEIYSEMFAPFNPSFGRVGRIDAWQEFGDMLDNPVIDRALRIYRDAGNP